MLRTLRFTNLYIYEVFLAFLIISTNTENSQQRNEVSLYGVQDVRSISVRVIKIMVHFQCVVMCYPCNKTTTKKDFD